MFLCLQVFVKPMPLLRIEYHHLEIHVPAGCVVLTSFDLLCLQVFITPMPLLRVAHALGLPHLRNLDEAVSIMRGAMLDVIQVRAGLKEEQNLQGFAPVIGFRVQVSASCGEQCLDVIQGGQQQILGMGGDLQAQCATLARIAADSKLCSPGL
jgi:hypothetical protein